MTPRRFIPGATYQHRRNQDVAMFVTKVQFAGNEYIQLRVRWWNLGHRSFCVEEFDTVRVQMKDLDGWKRIIV